MYAQVDERNVDAIKNKGASIYPPLDCDLRLSCAGREKDDPTVSLPTPEPIHILLVGEATFVSTAVGL
jgi:hypothetical protein